MEEIECFLRERRWNLRHQEVTDLVVETKPLKDYVIPTKEELHYNIVYQPIMENNFELKLILIGMVQKD